MQDERNSYVIKETMCPPGYHHNGFVETRALSHMMYDLYITGINKPKSGQQTRQEA